MCCSIDGFTEVNHRVFIACIGVVEGADVQCLAADNVNCNPDYLTR